LRRVCARVRRAVVCVCGGRAGAFENGRTEERSEPTGRSPVHVSHALPRAARTRRCIGEGKEAQGGKQNGREERRRRPARAQLGRDARATPQEEFVKNLALLRHGERLRGGALDYIVPSFGEV
jgi:hypothetical protein